MGDVASEGQYRYKGDKMKITAMDFCTRQPIFLQGGMVKYASTVVSLGVTTRMNIHGRAIYLPSLRKGGVP